MGAASFNDAFAGATREDYNSILVVERVPTIIIDGEPQGWRYITVYAAVTETTYRFVGLSSADAHTRSGSVLVRDADGNSYDVPLAPTVRNAPGPGVTTFITYSVKVSCKPISPHLWELVVREYSATAYI